MKQTYTPHKYTQHQIDEILKCRADPIYFIEKYVTSIPSPDGIFGNLWHNENDFTKLMLKFSDIYDDPKPKRTVLSEKQWKQEYECEFINTAIQQSDLF